MSSRLSPQPKMCCVSAGHAMPCLRDSKSRTRNWLAAIDERSLPVDRTGRIDRQLRTKVIFWSFAATVSLIVVAVIGMPLIATKLTPLIPYAIESRLGAAIDAQTRMSLDEGNAGVPLDCGNAEKEQVGRVAFE